MQGLFDITTTDYDDNGDYDELLNLFENCKNILKPHEKELKITKANRDARENDRRFYG